MKYIAHRGFGGLRVENTLAAFENAIALGAAGAELDLHLSRDGQVIVHHDDVLNPNYCRDGDGTWLEADANIPVASLTLAQLHTFDVGTPRPGTPYARAHNRVEAVADQRIPLLREVIELVRARSPRFRLIVEIKTPMHEAARKPWQALVDATLGVIDACDFTARATLCSFDWGALLYAKTRNPDMATWFTGAPLSWFRPGRPPTADIPPDADYLATLRHLHAGGNAPWYGGFDPRHFGDDPVRAVAAAGGEAWFPFHRDFTADIAGELDQYGLARTAWSVNLRDHAEIDRLARARLDYLVTDYAETTAP